MAFGLGSGKSSSPEINVTPLIDVLLVLLIIFMVVVSKPPQGLDSAVPQPGKAPEAAAGPVVVELQQADSGGVSYRVNGQAVTGPGLEAALRSLLAVRANRSLFVAAGREMSFQPVAEAVARAREAGAEPVALMGPVGH